MPPRGTVLGPQHRTGAVHAHSQMLPGSTPLGRNFSGEPSAKRVALGQPCQCALSFGAPRGCGAGHRACTGDGPRARDRPQGSSGDRVAGSAHTTPVTAPWAELNEGGATRTLECGSSAAMTAASDVLRCIAPRSARRMSCAARGDYASIGSTGSRDGLGGGHGSPASAARTRGLSSCAKISYTDDGSSRRHATTARTNRSG